MVGRIASSLMSLVILGGVALQSLGPVQADETPNPPELIRQLNIRDWQYARNYLREQANLTSYEFHSHGAWRYVIERDGDHFIAVTYNGERELERFDLNLIPEL